MPVCNSEKLVIVFAGPANNEKQAQRYCRYVMVFLTLDILPASG